MFFAYAISFSVIFYVFNASAVTYIITFAVIALITILMNSLVPSVLTTPTLKKLNDECDPYPLLNICDEILKYVKNPNEKLTATLNRCAALSNTGGSAESYKCLKAIAIDSYNGLTPSVKYVYYNNLADAALSLGEKEQADFAFGKSRECLAAIKNKKLHAQYADADVFMQTQFYIEEGESERALELMKSIDTTTVSRSVSVAFLSAKANIALGNDKKARIDLEYVIATGNKLCCVSEAEEMLAKISQ